MAKKELDWGTVADPVTGPAKVRLRDGGYVSFRDLVQKSMAKQEAAAEHQALMKAEEPLRKSKLLERMVNRQPIKVMGPIKNPTESIGGIQMDEEDDGFYANVRKSGDPSERTANSSFVEVMEVIPAGTELTFHHLNKTLNQWIFKSQKGKEYAIYTSPVVVFQGKQIQNPGFWGLLYSTDLILGDE